MKKRIVIFIICYCTYVSIYIARQNLSLAAPMLKALDVLNTEQIGVIGGTFFVVYACGRLLSSCLSNRIHPYIMIGLGLTTCGVSNLICGSLPTFQLFLLLWGMNAFAQSMLWGSILCVLTTIYSAEDAKKKASYMTSAVAIGNVIGIGLSSIVIQCLGVSWAFIVPGSITLLMALLIIIYVKPLEVVKIKNDNDKHKNSLIKDKKFRGMLVPALFHGVIKDNISLWMAVYVLDRFGMQLEESTAYILLIPALGFVGRLLVPALYQKCRNNEVLLINYSFIACGVITLILIYISKAAWVAITCLSLIYMAVSVINACMLAIFPIRFAQNNQTASASGIIDFATYIGTGIGSIVYGTLIQQLGYEAMFISWAVLCCLSFILLHKHAGKTI